MFSGKSHAFLTFLVQKRSNVSIISSNAPRSLKRLYSRRKCVFHIFDPDKFSRYSERYISLFPHPQVKVLLFFGPHLHSSSPPHLLSSFSSPHLLLTSSQGVPLLIDSFSKSSLLMISFSEFIFLPAKSQRPTLFDLLFFHTSNRKHDFFNFLNEVQCIFHIFDPDTFSRYSEG